MIFVPDEFLARFAIPLVAGGEVHVGAPLDQDDLEALAAEAASPGDTALRLEALRGRFARGSWITTVATPLDSETSRLLAGLHNLLFLSHPECERFSVRQRRRAELVAFTRWCLELDPPNDDAALVRRHSLLRNIGALMRTDVEIRFWVGRRRFRGQVPPARLLRWRELRRVREQREQTAFLAAPELSDDQRELLALLFAASPLTDLLLVDRPTPRQSWVSLLPHLRRPRVARLVCHNYLALGLERIGPALARQFWFTVAELEDARGNEFAASRREKRAVLRTLAQLIQYLYVAHCLVGEVEPAALVADDPTYSLWSVLPVASRQGLLAPREQLGATLVQQRFDQLLERSWQKLAGAADTLNRNLHDALSLEG